MTVGSPAQPVAEFGAWKLATIPPGWEVVPGFGLRRAQGGASSIGFREEPLPPGMSLAQYGESQTQALKQLVPALQAKKPAPSSWSGAEEALEMAWRLIEDDRQYLIVQVFAKTLDQVGIATFTTTDLEFAAAGPGFRSVREMMKFKPEPLPEPATSLPLEAPGAKP